MELEKESTELKHKVIKTVFVRVHERFGKQVFDVATVVKDGYINKTQSVVNYNRDNLSFVFTIPKRSIVTVVDHIG